MRNLEMRRVVQEQTGRWPARRVHLAEETGRQTRQFVHGICRRMNE